MGASHAIMERIALLLLAASPAATDQAGCPAGFKCYSDAQAFAKALGDSSGGPAAPKSAKLALLCPAESRCTVNGTQLGFLDGVTATVLMENVVLGPNDVGNDGGPNGAVLHIGTGNVTGTGLLIRGGLNAQYGGCVFNEAGTFSCTDCVFDSCACQTDDDGRGGGVYSSGHNLTLVRTQFTKNSCVDSGTTYGAGCWCEGQSEGHTAHQCGGCTCKASGGAFSCGNGPSSPPLPPLPPPAPPAPPTTCADFSGDWHFSDQYRAQIKQVGCALTLTATEPEPPCGTDPTDPPCRVEWLSPAPGFADGNTATAFFCDRGDTDCSRTWPHPVWPYKWAEINSTLSSDGQSLLWPKTCGNAAAGCVSAGNWSRGKGPAPVPARPPKYPKGDWPGACCAASAFGCGVSPQRCGSTECNPSPWVNCTDGKKKYCADCGFPACPNSTQC
jgi:hypothetical protein